MHICAARGIWVNKGNVFQNVFGIREENRRTYLDCVDILQVDARHFGVSIWMCLNGRLTSCCVDVHYDDVVMGAIASHITSLTIVYTTVYWDSDQSKHQSSASLAFVWGIHRGQRASYAENVSIWWRHHGKLIDCGHTAVSFCIILLLCHCHNCIVLIQSAWWTLFVASCNLDLFAAGWVCIQFNAGTYLVVNFLSIRKLNIIYFIWTRFKILQALPLMI